MSSPQNFFFPNKVERLLPRRVSLARAQWTKVASANPNRYSMTVVNSTNTTVYVMIQDDLPTPARYYNAGRLTSGALLSFGRLNDGDIVTSGIWIYIASSDNAVVNVVESEVIR